MIHLPPYHILIRSLFNHKRMSQIMLPIYSKLALIELKILDYKLTLMLLFPLGILKAMFYSYIACILTSCWSWGFQLQILTYLLMSASSSAATRAYDWVSNWGEDKFPYMANASVALSLVAFVAFALASLVSGSIVVRFT